MPRKPEVKSLNATSVEVLNVIRENASPQYRNAVPMALATTESIRAIGETIMNFPTLQNEFLDQLVNRIGRVIITSKLYENPWAMFKKGILEYGEVIEELFVNIAKPYEYNVQEAEDTVFKREIPDVRAAFHVMNYRKVYPTTVQNSELKLAFLSWEGVTDLIGRIIDSLYTGANYDEFLTMKYMIARHILQGDMYPVDVGAGTTKDDLEDTISTIKGVSNLLEFESTEYNRAGVYNFTKKDDQFLIVNAKFEARFGVKVLAAAFNMNQAEFMGHRVLIDSFGALDERRLAELFAEDSTYKPLTAAEKEALDSIPAVLVDRDFFMIFDNKYEMTDIFNPKGLYWNYFYHVWKTFSVSPFANAIVMLPAAPTVTAVTVSPTAATLTTVGETLQLTATVTGDNFPPSKVNWTVETGKDKFVTVSDTGLVTYVEKPTQNTGVKITATSVYDSTKTAICQLTLPPA